MTARAVHAADGSSYRRLTPVYSFRLWFQLPPVLLFRSPPKIIWFLGAPSWKIATSAHRGAVVQIIHGTEDVRTEPEGSEAFVAAAASEDKTLLLYEGAKHLLFYDTPEINKRSKDDLTRWMLDRVDA